MSSIGGKINEKRWGSSWHGKIVTQNQHRKNKKWNHTCAPKRSKWRWNKKTGERERSTKGSKEYHAWAD